MKINLGYRKGGLTTNYRLDAFAEGLATSSNLNVTKCRRDYDGETDLYVQSGFQNSRGLRNAIDRRVPYLILELPYFRPTQEYTDNTVSFAFNGIAGGGWTPAAPTAHRPHPLLMPMRQDTGDTMIFGQKPNDHSLGGHDHVKWIKDMQEAYPDARFRHHPIMSAEKQEPIADALDRITRAVTFSSTAGVEALIAGVHSNPESPLSMAHNVLDREEWLHELSWKQFTLSELGHWHNAEYITHAYPEALYRAEQGKQMIPRTKDTAIMGVYFNEFGN